MVEWSRSQDASAGRSYFAALLGDVSSPTELTGPRGRRESDRHVHGSHEQRVEGEAARRVHECARSSGVTVGSVVQCAWAAALCVFASSDDVVYGSTVSGRPSSVEDADRVCGMLINTLPMRVRAGESTSCREAMRSIHAQTGALSDLSWVSSREAASSAGGGGMTSGELLR